eukprot:gnl/TRDRNA2_/TRDRNA2_125874_c0_seq2.p1 gnl/TRDRNA2_/TRDRNA2_125874_c0~~gnl/TRDRNA2_/TRDRNA2_125874_c0_seq2.p1  ORF type:complete len:346 (-),score=57.56 gnl/TRDRNA2_/TRDRNA2_125874_c0_seq2:61-1098(-)
MPAPRVSLSEPFLREVHPQVASGCAKALKPVTLLIGLGLTLFLSQVLHNGSQTMLHAQEPAINMVAAGMSYKPRSHPWMPSVDRSGHRSPQMLDRSSWGGLHAVAPQHLDLVTVRSRFQMNDARSSQTRLPPAHSWNPFGGDAKPGEISDWADTDDITIARVQVGLLGIARDIQKKLDDIAENADSDSQEGLHDILTDTVLALLRKPEMMVYGYCDSFYTDSPERAEERFNDYSLQERSKYDEETLSNVEGRTRDKTGLQTPPAASGLDSKPNQYIVVTILLAYDGQVKLPQVDTLEDAKKVLQFLGRTQAFRVNAVEILWNPQQAGDTLPTEEIMGNYPQLRPL